MFLTHADEEISNEFLSQGYIIRPVADFEALKQITNYFINIISDNLKIKSDLKHQDIFNKIHQNISAKEINNFRMNLIDKVNSIQESRQLFYKTAAPYLESLVGNELAMQVCINLNIQLPGDDSSLLPIHSDIWSGDSPFEIVVWLPLVDCFKTKSMYIISPKNVKEVQENYLNNYDDKISYHPTKDKVKFLKVNYGEVLLFNQALPHGNFINEESETRFSLNARFKNIFTPYCDKKLGEFFQPISLRVVSKIGLEYKFPKIL